ncbi:MAG: UxaA family hydrolase, partial [Rubripirellula sp.]
MNRETENSGLIRLDPADNVAVATKPLKRGETIEIGGHSLVVAQDIPAGHKIAVCNARVGESIVKYGQPIGLVTADISPGDHVHTQNLADHHVVSDDLSEINPPPSP